MFAIVAFAPGFTGSSGGKRPGGPQASAALRVAGVFIVRRGCSAGQVVSYLELVAHAGEAADYQDAVTYLP
jgi:hypothetical protein